MPAQQMQLMAELAQLRKSSVRDALTKVLQDCEGRRTEPGRGRRVGLHLQKGRVVRGEALEKQMNAQGAGVGSAWHYE